MIAIERLTYGTWLCLLAAAVSAETPVAADERPALPFPPGITAESVCGTTDDLQDVELYDGTLGVTRQYADDHQVNTVQLQWIDLQAMAAALPGKAMGNVAGARWCTGTLIRADLVLTAGHCFDIQDGETGWLTPFDIIDGQIANVQPGELAKLQVVHFLYQIDGATMQPRVPSTFPVVELVEHRRAGLDYALIRLGRNAEGHLPGDGFPIATVSIQVPADEARLAILQHPHGWPKKIEAGKLLDVVGPTVKYDDIDTYGGSSGSGVRDADGRIIAVHTHGGCNNHGGNKGVSTEAIAKVSDEL